MNSLYENQSVVEDYASFVTRMGDALCTECKWVAIHKDNCSKSK